jgi:hypothetical protein
MDTTMTSGPVPAMPMPARTVREQLAAIGAGARFNEFYELVYPDA